MILTNKRVENPPVLYIGSDQIKRVDTFKYLGVHIDKNLKYNSHYNYLEARLSQLCGVSYRLRNQVNIRTAKNFYFSCVYGLFTYCLAVFGGMALCTAEYKQVEKLQGRILRNLFGRLYPASPCLFKTLKILKFREAYKLRAATYVYRVLKRDEFPCLRDQLELRYPDHDYTTRSTRNEDVMVPTPRVEAIKLNFEYQFPHVWNEIPQDLKNSRSLGIFKKKVTERFINSY